jgi:lysophosphatidate acyltransferase
VPLSRGKSSGKSGQGYRASWTDAHLGPQGRPAERTDQAPSMLFSALILKPLAYFGLPVYVLHRLSQTSPLVRYYIRNILYICSVGLCSTVGFCAAVPLTLLGRRYDVNYIVARTFYATFGRLSGLRVVVEGEEHLNTRPCVLVGNHQSMLDLLYLGRCAASPVIPSQCPDLLNSMFPRGTRMMSKQSLKYVPLLGQFMQAAGAVFIDRGNNAVAVRSLQTAGEEIKRCHTSIWVFPEGTRTSRPYHDLRAFKKGAFHLAIQAGLPLVPVVAENYWNLYHQGHSEFGTFKVRGVTASLHSRASPC